VWPGCSPAAGDVRALSIGSDRLPARRLSFRQTFEVEDPADQQRLLLDAAVAPTTEASQAMPIFGFTEQFLNELAATLRESIARTAYAHPNARMRGRAPACLYGDVRFDVPREHRRDEVGMKEALVRSERRGPKSQAAFRTGEQRQAAPLFRSHPLEDVDAETEQKPVTVLHHRVDRVAGVGAGARAALRDESAVRVSRRAMGRVAPLLATEIPRAIARILPIALVRPILRPQPALVLLGIERDLNRHEALVARVRADECAVGTDMVAHQARGHRLLGGRVEQLLQDAG